MTSIDTHNGKTVESIEKGETYVLIRFTDGTVMEIGARGTEHSWIEVD